MKAKDIEIGQIYQARVSGVVRRVKVTREHTNYQGRTRFDALNLETNRTLVLSAARLRHIGHPKIQSCQCGTCGHQLAATCRGKHCVCCPCCPPRPTPPAETDKDEAERKDEAADNAADPAPADQQDADDMQPASEDEAPGLDDDAIQGALDAIAGTIAEAVAQPCNAAPPAPVSERYAIRELTTCNNSTIYRVVEKVYSDWQVVLPSIDYDLRRDAEYKLTELQAKLAPAPLTPPGTVQANDEATANLQQIRQQTAAGAIRNGFGHRGQVAPALMRRRIQRMLAPPQGSLFEPPPQQGFTFGTPLPPADRKRETEPCK